MKYNGAGGGRSEGGDESIYVFPHVNDHSSIIIIIIM